MKRRGIREESTIKLSGRQNLVFKPMNKRPIREGRITGERD